MVTALELFTAGMILSYGPCLAHCSGVMIPYIAASGRGWKSGFADMLVFLLIRSAVYAVLGLLAGTAGRAVSTMLHDRQRLLLFSVGLCIIGFGAAVMLGRDPSSRMCRRLHGTEGASGRFSLIILSITLSAVPCASLLAVLAYISLQAETPLTGLLFGLSFGAGKLVSPLIPLGAAAGYASGRFSHEKFRRAVTLLSGGIMVFFGLRLMWW